MRLFAALACNNCVIPSRWLIHATAAAAPRIACECVCVCVCVHDVCSHSVHKGWAQHLLPLHGEIYASSSRCMRRERESLFGLYGFMSALLGAESMTNAFAAEATLATRSINSLPCKSAAWYVRSSLLPTPSMCERRNIAEAKLNFIWVWKRSFLKSTCL
jgi:hypothetical protein